MSSDLFKFKNGNKNEKKTILRKIRSKLFFHRMIYAFVSIIMAILIYSASMILLAVSDDLNNAMAHDKKLKDKYNSELERYNANPDKYRQPMQPEYITMNVLLLDSPYIILSVSIYIGIYMCIAMTFFYLFPPIYHRNKKANYRIGGISRIIEYDDTHYIVAKSSYFSPAFLVDISDIVLTKKIGTVLNKLSFTVINDSSLFAVQDDENNIILKKHDYERTNKDISEIDKMLVDTLRKGVKRVKTASKSNYMVTIQKELMKSNDMLLEEANNTLEADVEDL